jgi:hypothetical protein
MIADRLLANKANRSALFVTKFEAGEVYVDTGNDVKMPLSKYVRN